MKKIKLLTLLLVILICISGCKSKNTDFSKLYTSNNLNLNFKIIDNKLNYYNGENWESFNIKAVNFLDYFPDKKETLSKDDYISHISKIKSLNTNAIKIDDLFPPTFYQALNEYNMKNDDKIFLIQGIPMNLETFETNKDPFKLDNNVPYKDKISITISAINGDLTLPTKVVNNKEVGGKYTSNISPYVIAYILGSDWDNEVILHTNEHRTDKEELNTEFVQTISAKPFEVFLADIINHTLEYEAKKYSFIRPISVLSFPEKDNIKHNYNLNPDDDLVSVNTNAIKLKGDETSFFTTYEVFPYEPDFINLDPKYTKYIDHRGNTNNYAGYLHELIESHDDPIFIGKFGVPSSRGISNISTSNKNKGYLNEVSQGNIISDMYEDIIIQGSIGGAIYSWQNDLNKSTYNCPYFANNEKWINTINPDENFGLFEYTTDDIFIDGNFKDWKSQKIEPIYEKEKKEESIIEKIYASNDFKNIYFGIQFDKSFNKDENDIMIFLDTLENSGLNLNPVNENITIDGTDFILHINGQKSKIFVDSKYSVLDKILDCENILDEDDNKEDIDSESSNLELGFVPIKSLISKEYISKNNNINIPQIDFEIGKLINGNTNTESEEFNSIADYYYNEKDKFLEVRIPYGLINFKDPSKKEILNLNKEPVKINYIKFALSVSNKTKKDDFIKYPKNNFFAYTWDNWDELNFNKRLKLSTDIIKETFSKY